MPNCYQSRVINAPIEKVWETIECFHTLDWAPNVITSCEKIGDKKGSQVSAKRLLNKAFEETLLSIDKENHIFSYSIDKGAGPVEETSNYIGIVSLRQITQTNETYIEWKSSWDAKTNDAEEFCHVLYVQMMNDLNSHLSN